MTEEYQVLFKSAENLILFVLSQIVILAYTCHVYKQTYTIKSKLLTIAFFCALEYVLIIPMMPRPMPLSGVAAMQWKIDIGFVGFLGLISGLLWNLLYEMVGWKPLFWLAAPCFAISLVCLVVLLVRAVRK